MSHPEVLEVYKSEDVKFISFCFTDIAGQQHAITYNIDAVSSFMIHHGICFDGSSIKGWKEINNSDTILKPDFSTAYIDPFTSDKTLRVICNVFDPITNTYYTRDPRSIAQRSIEYLLSTGIADTPYFGPELEYFVFDNVAFSTSPYSSFYHLDSEENPTNNASYSHDIRNLAHRPKLKGGYFPIQPIDKLFDLRSEISNALLSIGVQSTIHHHEVGASQCEVGFMFASMLDAADNVQKVKHIVKNVANAYGKTATFMPKPIWRDNGSGMHVHQSLWKNSNSLFFEDGKYADLSETALYYIGGIIKHAKALNAFTNPTTNSYKRLVPGYEAPVKLAYSANNRSAAIRIPFSFGQSSSKRIEVRFPDPAANPYMAFATMLMAGIDGIINKISPQQPIDENLYTLSEDELNKIPSVSSSLEESLQHLNNDREFLSKGGVS
jgi:glutamine synthetase